MTFVANSLGQAGAVAGLMPGRYMSDRWVTGWWAHRHDGVRMSTVAWHGADGAVLSTHDVCWPVEPTPLTANYVGWLLGRARDCQSRYVTVTPVQWHSRECGTIPPVLMIGRRPRTIGPDGVLLGDPYAEVTYQMAWEEAHPPR